MVTAVASLAAFLQVLGGACTQASNSLVTGRGEGWGYTLFLWQPEGRHGQAGLSQGPAFSFCVHLRKAGKGDYLQAYRSDRA